jgi:hypothetical protein
MRVHLRTLTVDHQSKHMLVTAARQISRFDFSLKNYMEITYKKDCYRGLTNIYQHLPLMKSESLSVSTKVTLYKALIRSILTDICPAWELAADSHLLQFYRLQNKVLRTIGNLPRRTPTHDLHMPFKIPYSHDFVIKLCR